MDQVLHVLQLINSEQVSQQHDSTSTTVVLIAVTPVLVDT